MPRVTRFKIAAIEDLFRQLRYAPVAKRVLQMNAVEGLIDDIDTTQNYPEDFIIFRITGYRPQFEETPAVFVGEALLPDLITLVQRLSDDLTLPSDFEGRKAALIADAAKKLNISTKTVQRYRKQGLVCHYVTFDDQVKRLVCFEDAIDRFVARNERRLKRASRFTRIGEGNVQRMIEQAANMHREAGVSLNEAARRLASEHGRAHETVRLILKRHDRRAERPIFDEYGPLTQKDIRLVFRAWKFGVPVAELARRFGKGSPAIHRAINRRRHELLRELSLISIELPTFHLEDAESVILASPVVTSGLNEGLPDDDALGLIDRAHEAEALTESDQDGLIAGYHFLKMRSARSLDALVDAPGSMALDQVETSLRWATRLKRRLVSAVFPAALLVIEQTLHRDLARHPAEEIVHLLEMGIEVVSRSVENHDPTRKGERLERVCAHAMGRAMAALYRAKPLSRAGVRHEDREIKLSCPLGRLCPWQAWLEPRPGWPEVVERLGPEDRRLIEHRYGWDGGPPHSIEELVELFQSTPHRLSRGLLRIERELRKEVRAKSS